MLRVILKSLFRFPTEVLLLMPGVLIAIGFGTSNLQRLGIFSCWGTFMLMLVLFERQLQIIIKGLDKLIHASDARHLAETGEKVPQNL